jgi:hypothetical protein
MGIEASRESARAILARLRPGLPAFEPRGETFGAVVANWLKRHVESKGLRSRYQIERLLVVHVPVIRAIANWYATRHEDYNSPVVRGMRRTNPKEHARSRVLTDEELCAVWRVAEASGTSGALVRLLLTTAQRHR